MTKIENKVSDYGTKQTPIDKEIENDAIDLDDVLTKIGEFGLYQKLLLWFVCLPACLPCGFCAFNQLFMTDTPDHWCKVPELELLNITQEQIKSISIPRTDNITYEKCYRYAVKWSKILDKGGQLLLNYSWPIEPCYDGYVYNTSEIESSVVIDFNLVCDYDVYPTLGLVALNIGGPVGVYSFGLLNDRIGRKKTFFICLTTLLIGSIMTAYAHEFWIWALARVIVGLTIPAIYQIPFIISLELAGPNYRSFVTVMTCIFYTLGLILLSVVTYLLRDWKALALVTSMPFFSYYLYWFVLPESPRWLLMQEQFEEANNILKTIARTNNTELPDENQDNVGAKTASVFSLCRTPNMRLKTCLITLNWCASEMVYVGLSYYGPAIGENQYMSFFLSSAVEIPSYIVCWILMDRIGRRWPLCLSMVISGIFCIVTVLLPTDATNETLILYLISKCFISASFLIIYPYAGELYPTELRGVGIGTSAYIGGLGLIIIPFVNYLGSSNLVLPLVIMGAVSVVGGLSALRLPETLHCSLPQTAEEGEEFGNDWTYADCFKCGEQRQVVSDDSYENLDQLELTGVPLCEEPESSPLRRSSMRRLVRQTSTVETQRDIDGNINMTYWF
ncbi:hypothetical protein K1T71_002638 [Dendrolimus kikuchii]|uniref:Uncharacterized protein n=1 Tax=Dendrolimus kikuchii TaxID=765133 RepID=A0ACC1DDI9_9NEOP|nr:hypothetical protein K1T71_002638 [Dendrolimus kikuchii]